MEAIELIQSHGQSVWLDLASEDLRSDHFLDWIEQGWITGITSATGLMPESHLQGLIEDPWLRLQAHAGVQDDEILQSLLIESYRKIADILLPTFERTNGEDGFVSLDIDPRDVQDREAFLNVSLNVWNEVNRPNLLISIPATTENMFVLAESLERGVNVNASMVCSIEQYLEVVDIYFSSLEKRLERGSGIEHIVSTASFPIGLIDRHVNRHLGEFKGEGTGAKRAGALSDQVGLSIAKLAYAQFNLSFNSDRFQNLSMQRGRVQRLLWTGFSNNENVSAWGYIEQLIGPHTIIAPKLNTLSELHSGEILGPTVEEGLSEARGKLQALESIGISMPQVVSEIKASILKEQREAILTVLEEIHERRNKLECELKPVISQYREVLNELESMEIIHRVWQADTSLWGSDRRVQKYLPAMMGWLNLHLHVNEIIQECSSFIQELQKEDRTKLVMVTEGSVGLLVKALAYQSGSEANNLIVLNLFDPDQLQSTVEKLDPKRAQCVFIVGSHHDEMLHESLDVIRPIFHEANEEDPSDFVSLITYPETVAALESVELAVRKVFSIPTNLPFHFSALGYPGMLAAAWVGRDIKAISEGLGGVMNRCLPATPVDRNPGLAFASSVAGAVRSGVRRIILSADSDWSRYCEWIAAFWDDTGLFEHQDVDVSLDMKLETLSSKGNNQLVVFLTGIGSAATKLEELIDSGVPIKVINLPKTDGSIGELVGLVSFSTAVLASIWKHDPFTLEA